MTLSLTDEKRNKVKTLLINCLNSHQVSRRELARILENIIANFQAVTFEPLHYSHLERDKIRGSKYHKGNFAGKISLSSKAVSEIHWWINNIDNSCHYINNIPNPIHAIILTTLTYTQMLVLHVGELPLEYPHLKVSGIRQN